MSLENSKIEDDAGNSDFCLEENIGTGEGSGGVSSNSGGGATAACFADDSDTDQSFLGQRIRSSNASIWSLDQTAEDWGDLEIPAGQVWKTSSSRAAVTGGGGGGGDEKNQILQHDLDEALMNFDDDGDDEHEDEEEGLVLDSKHDTLFLKAELASKEVAISTLPVPGTSNFINDRQDPPNNLDDLEDEELGGDGMSDFDNNDIDLSVLGGIGNISLISSLQQDKDDVNHNFFDDVDDVEKIIVQDIESIENDDLILSTPSTSAANGAKILSSIHSNATATASAQPKPTLITLEMMAAMSGKPLSQPVKINTINNDITEKIFDEQEITPVLTKMAIRPQSRTDPLKIVSPPLHSSPTLKQPQPNNNHSFANNSTPVRFTPVQTSSTSVSRSASRQSSNEALQSQQQPRTLSRQSSKEALPASSGGGGNGGGWNSSTKTSFGRPPLIQDKLKIPLGFNKVYVKRIPQPPPTPAAQSKTTPVVAPPAERWSSGSTRDMRRPATHRVAFGRTLKESPQPQIKVKPRKQPTLIRNLASADTPKVVGSMVYDPVLKRWSGNEAALNVFEKASQSPSARPTLIKHNPHDLSSNKSVGGMTFDPVKCVWVGNETDGEAHLFDEIDSFEVQKESNKSLGCDKQTRDIWTKSETSHKLFMGWWYPKANDSRFIRDSSKLHLWEIRNMVLASSAVSAVY